MSTPYQGKFVFIEAVITDPAKHSSHNNGEYFCIRQTPATLYCTKLGDVYGMHELKQFNLVGDTRHKVIESWSDDAALRESLESVKEVIAGVNSGRIKAKWVDSVYSGAASAIRTIERMFSAPPVEVSIEKPAVLDVTVPAGVKQVRLNFA